LVVHAGSSVSVDLDAVVHGVPDRTGGVGDRNGGVGHKSTIFSVNGWLRCGRIAVLWLVVVHVVGLVHGAGVDRDGGLLVVIGVDGVVDGVGDRNRGRRRTLDGRHDWVEVVFLAVGRGEGRPETCFTDQILI
jgi:hypothetical protein